MTGDDNLRDMASHIQEGFMRTIGILVVAAMTTASALLFTPTASADTAACIKYLTDNGKDTTARNEICQTTETLGDTVSQEYALFYCDVAMAGTGLSQEAVRDMACELAVAP